MRLRSLNVRIQEGPLLNFSRRRRPISRLASAIHLLIFPRAKTFAASQSALILQSAPVTIEAGQKTQMTPPAATRIVYRKAKRMIVFRHG